MRTRCFRDVVQADTTGSGDYMESGSHFYTAATNPNTDYDVYFDVVTEDFTKRRNLGEVFFNPMARETTFVRSSGVPTVSISGSNPSGPISGTMVADPGPNWTLAQSYCAGNFSGLDSFLEYWGISDWKDPAVTSAWADVDLSEALFLASLGELPETLKYFRDVMYRLIRILKSLVSKQARFAELRRFRNSTLEWNDLWLEARYAIRPLFFEVEAIRKAIATQIDYAQRYTGRGKFEREAVITSDADLFIWNGITGKLRRTTTVSMSARAGVLYSLHPEVPNLAAVFGIQNPLESVYELVTLSFVIDWIINLGDVIASLEVSPSAHVFGSWCSQKYSIVDEISLVDVDTTWNNIGYSDVVVQVSDPGTQRAMSEWSLRTIEPTRPLKPSFSINLDMAKIIDLVGIAKGLMKSLRK